MNEADIQAKYEKLLKRFIERPDETYVYVPFQDHPNLPGFKINTIRIDDREMWHGLSGQSAKKDALVCIPIFSEREEAEKQPSYMKHFE